MEPAQPTPPPAAADALTAGGVSLWTLDTATGALDWSGPVPGGAPAPTTLDALLGPLSDADRRSVRGVIDLAAEVGRADVRARFRTVLGPATECWVRVAPVPGRPGAVAGALVQLGPAVPWSSPDPGVSEAEAPGHSAARLAAIIEGSDDAIVSKDLSGTITSWNRGAERLFGYTADEAVGRHVTMLIPPEHRAEESMILASVRAGRRIDHYETIRLTKDGRRIPVSLTVSPVRDAEGRVIGASKIARDIGERLRSEEARWRLAAIVESSDDAIVSKDLSGAIVSWNAGARRLFGYAPEEIIGRHITTLIPPELRPEEDAILARIRAGERVAHFDTVRVTKDGRRIPVSLTVSPVRDAEGRVIGASKIARDISERLETQARLARHNELLREAVDRTRAELERSGQALRLSERMAALGTMAAGLGHDIGNLLLPLRAHLDLIKERHPDEGTAEDVRAIDACADYFAALVRGLRMFGRSGAADRDGVTDLAAWCRDAMPLLRGLVGERVALATPGCTDGLPPVAVPQSALAQVLVNLVKNAADAIRAAGVGARVEVRTRREPGHVVVEVADDGPGMTPDVLARCMEPYFTTRVRGQQPGTGLGLAIVHRTITEAGGRVEVESSTGDHGLPRGTTIRLHLPLAKAGGPEPEPPGVEIVLPDRPARRLLASTLASLGYQVRVRDLPDAAPAPTLDPEAALWVVDAALVATLDLSARSPRAPVVVIGAGPDAPPDERLIHLGANPAPRDVLGMLRRLTPRPAPTPA